MDYSQPGSSVHEISRARIQKWTAISSFRGLPDPGIEPPESPASPALAGRFFTIQILILVYDKYHEGVGDMLYMVAKEGISEEGDILAKNQKMKRKFSRCDDLGIILFIPSRMDSKCKGPETGNIWECLSKPAGWAQWVRQSMWDEVSVRQRPILWDLVGRSEEPAF